MARLAYPNGLGVMAETVSPDKIFLSLKDSGPENNLQLVLSRFDDLSDIIFRELV